MKKLIIANWKMNPETHDQARRTILSLEHRMHFVNDKAKVVICPPALFLPPLSHHAHYVSLGAQNLYWEEVGAFTGEISALQLASFKVEYAILGHSERRIYFNESDQGVNLKLHACLKHKLTPVLCLGGDPKAKKSGMKKIILKQFAAALKNVKPSDWHKIVFVYEPIWAISTMKHAEPATGEHASELISYIRSLIAKKLGLAKASNIHVLYGGSVNKNNVHEFSKFPTIDGALVGAASLDPDNFMAIVKEFHRESIHKA